MSDVRLLIPRVATAVALIVLAGACTPAGSSSGEETDENSEVFETASAFVDAWNERDYEAMNSFFTAESFLSEEQLGREMRNVLRAGAVDSFQVSIEEPTPASAESFPYSLAITSTASKRPLTFDGDLRLVFDDVEQAWEIVWKKALFFPGIAGARGFAIETRWLKRGSIFDRDGRRLATGDVASRRYPFGSLAGTTIGHIGQATKEQALELGVAPGDLVGASGLEQGLQERLAGRPETTLTVVDRKGKVLERLGRRKGRKGENVKTTLDVEVQRAAENAYGSTTGGAVVMEPQTGGLLAVVSSSPFNPNNYVGAAGVLPFNRAVEGLYPPGSSMKVVTAGAALDSGTVTPSTQLTGPANYQGVTNFESGEFGSLTFASAVQFSVNTAFAQVARKIGAKRMTRYAEAFGFNKEPELPLEDTKTPSFPLPDDLGDLMWGSIGQAQVVATPLQMASIAATVANGGVRMEPRIVTDTKPKGERAISKRAARTLTELMINVVVGGTGQAARLAGLDVAGKTGTAEVSVDGEIKNHAWFVCFAPAGDPDVAVAVVSEFGGVGGQVAAPLARQILASTLLIVQADEFRAGKD
ncbi:MAG: penicillin-binding transpeptidase domain-containing protein [Actinomycetota bacterium]